MRVDNLLEQTKHYCLNCKLKITMKIKANVRTQLCDSCLEKHKNLKLRDFIEECEESISKNE